jgi:hypothetical protein
MLDATAQGFVEFLMIASNASEIPGDLLFLEVIGWAGGEGACLSSDCFDFFLVNGSFGLETSIVRLPGAADPVIVPEPQAALLVLASLALLMPLLSTGSAQWRRRELGAPRRT